MEQKHDVVVCYQRWSRRPLLGSVGCGSRSDLVWWERDNAALGCFLRPHTPNTEFLKKLFLYNLKVDDETDSGNTPLHWIRKRTTVEMVKLVIKRGYPVNAVAEDGITPLSQALLVKSREVAGYLVLEEGADVNEGGTGLRGSSLHIACREPGLGLEWVKLLVEYGSSIN